MKLVIGILIAALAWASGEVRARSLYPGDKQLHEIRDLCGGGKITSRQQRRVKSALKQWRNQSEEKDDTSEASKDLAAILDKVTSDAEGNDLYAKYVGCVHKQVDEWLTRANEPAPAIAPRGRVESFFTVGATYGSIRTADEHMLTNDNQLIWLGRVGWRFNRHIAFGLEGSFWQAKANPTGLPSGSVGFDEPVLARGIRTSIDSPSTMPVGAKAREPYRTVLSFGVALSLD